MGREFIDPDWPGATKRIAMDLDKETLEAIKQKILSISEQDNTPHIAL